MGKLCDLRIPMGSRQLFRSLLRNKSKEARTKSPSLSIIFGLSSKTQWLSGLYYADFISFYSPTQLCGGGTTKSNSNELPISVPLSLFFRRLLYPIFDSFYDPIDPFICCESIDGILTRFIKGHRESFTIYEYLRWSWYRE